MSSQETSPTSSARLYNWRIWTGFLLAVIAFVSYFAVFVKFPVTRDIPWATWLLFALSIFLLGVGIGRAVRQPLVYRGKIVGPILGVLGLGIAGLFGFFTIYGTRQVPPSAAAPKVGSRAPDFELADVTGKTVTLTSLLTDPMPLPVGAKPRGVILIFYRGYW
jgi:hypothetical protein